MKKPFIPLQSEPSECGVIAVAALTAIYNLGLCPQAIKAKYGVSSRGLSVSQLLTMLRDAGFGAQAVLVDSEKPDAIALPAIALWEDKHFIVVSTVSHQACDVFDPERGWISIPLDEFKKGLSGLVVEVTSVPATPILPLRKPLRLRQWISKFNIKKALIKVCLVSAVAQLGSVLLPLLAKDLVDYSVTPSQESLLYWTLAGYAVVGLFGVVISSIAARLAANVSSILIVEMADDVTRRILAKPVEFISRNLPAVLAGKVQTVQVIQQLILQFVSSSLISGCVAVLAIFGLLWISPVFAVVILSIRAVGFLVDRPLMRMVAHSTERRHRALVIQMAAVTETIKASASLRAARALGKSIEKIKAKSEELAIASVNLNSNDQTRSDIKSIVGLVEQLAYLGLGTFLVSNNTITFGEFIALGLYKQFVNTGFSEFQDLNSSIMNVNVATGRLEGIVQPEHPTPSHEPVAAADFKKATVEFNGVNFSYSAFDQPILTNFNLKIADGECVAIVGASGSGKSTIAKLCTGALVPSSGYVAIGGEMLAEENESSLLAHIGTVMQSDHLITSSIFENISFHRNVELELVRKAAALACIDDFIMSLPMRYNTPISDEYSGLSGGQRQRIILARAICSNPRILVMDEATSALDAETESQIAANIRSMTMTRVIFAHRMETIRSADRIVKLH